MVIDPITLGKAIAQRADALDRHAEDILYPIILGCYGNEESENDLHALKQSCHNSGFTNAILLKDIPDPQQPQTIDYNIKFKLLIKEYKEDPTKRRIICPIIYIHDAINKGKGKGLISEFFDVITYFPELREFTVVLKHTTIDFIEQLNYVHPQNVYHIISLKEGMGYLVPHLKGHMGFLKQTLWQTESLKRKNTHNTKNEVTSC